MSLSDDPSDLLDEQDEILPIDKYNADEGKMQASILWLIAKVYEQRKNVPDALEHPFVRDNNVGGNQNILHLKPPAMYSLTSGDLYCSATAKIFGITDSAFLAQSHSAVLHELGRLGLAVVDPASGEKVTETVLKMEAPLRIPAHLALIDALMCAQMRMVISVERVLDVVGRYTSVDQNETPHDLEDALLFWINKICAAVRDNLEKIQRRQGGSLSDVPQIPEMEDLYEDMVDGACVATLVSFYRPNTLPITEICLADSMGLGDCAYNLRLLQTFCHRQLDSNVFHFAVEDLLYLHENLQPNVQAFLTELFVAFEGTGCASQSSPASGTFGRGARRSSSRRRRAAAGNIVNDSHSLTGAAKTAVNHQSSNPPSAGRRRMVPDIHPIPDLRSGSNSKHPSNSSSTFMRMKNPQLASNMNASLMNSVDSLMTQRSVDSLRYQPFKAANNQGGGKDNLNRSSTTTFGDLPSPSTATAPSQPGDTTDGTYGRSDSMPGHASLKLAIAEKRRAIEQQRAQRTAAQARQHEKALKNAFFTHIGKPPNSSRSPTTNGRHHQDDHDQPTSSGQPQQQQPGTSEDRQLLISVKEQLAMLNSEVKRLSQDQTQIHRRLEDDRQSQHHLNMTGSVHDGYHTLPISHAVSQPAVYNPAAMAQQQQQPQHSGSPLRHTQQASPSGLNQQQQQPPPSPHNSFTLHQQQQPPHGSPNTQPRLLTQLQQQQGLPTAMSAQQLSYPPQPPLQQQQHSPQPTIHENSSGGGSTFRLHADNEPASRLDPALELNRNLTNWGMTYKAGGGKTPRRTWDSERWQKEMSNAQFTNQSPARRPPSALYEFDQQQQQMQQQQQPRAVSEQYHQPDDSASSAPQPEGSRSQLNTMINQQAAVISPPPSVVQRAKSSEPDAHSSHRTSFSETSAAAAVPTTNLASQSPSVSGSQHFVIGSDVERKTLEQEQKREQLLANAMRRREKMDAKRTEMEAKEAKRKEELARKQEADAQKKLENEQRRQRIREQYEKRKAEQTALQEGLEAGDVHSTPRSPKKQPALGNRATSQPPGRPKSSVQHSSSMRSAKKHGGSSATVNLADSNGMKASESADKLDNAGRPRVPVASTQEPVVKPFVKPRRNSNRNIIINALQYTVFAGVVHEAAKGKVMEDMAKADSKHFLLLFRDRKCQYRGMYIWDEESNAVHKICGIGPKIITEDMMTGMFKYDSGGKAFNEVPGMKHLATTIDGFAIKDDFWKAAKKAADANKAAASGATTPSGRR